MGKHLALYFLAAGLYIGCGGQLRHLAYPPQEDPIPALLLLSHSPDAEKFETLAYAHFIRGDYVRALRYAYRASQAAPEDLRLRLLLRLIYDRGLGRPDLALPEYGRVLHLREGLTTRLHPRIHYLYHRLQER